MDGLGYTLYPENGQFIFAISLVSVDRFNFFSTNVTTNDQCTYL